MTMIYISFLVIFIFLGTTAQATGKILKAFPIKNFKTVQIETPKSVIQITKSPSSAFTQVEYTKKNFDEKQCTLTIENNSPNLTIRAQSKTSAPCEVDFSIVLPQDADIQINGGDIKLDAAVHRNISVNAGTAEIKTHNPKNLKVNAGTLILKAESIQGECHLSAGQLNTDLIYQSIPSTKGIINISGGMAKISLTVPESSKILDSIESPLYSPAYKDSSPNFILKGSSGTVEVSVKKIPDPAPVVVDSIGFKSPTLTTTSPRPVSVSSPQTVPAINTTIPLMTPLVPQAQPDPNTIENPKTPPQALHLGKNEAQNVLEILEPVLSTRP